MPLETPGSLPISVRVVVFAVRDHTGVRCKVRHPLHLDGRSPPPGLGLRFSAVYAVGGYPLYYATLAMYLVSAVLAMEEMSLSSWLPRHEKRWIYAIGLASGVVAYGRYSWTLEACSVWCWSAFSYGIYFCFLR